MSDVVDARITTLPPSAFPLRPNNSLVRWICTSNPFYALSAALFLAGLWISFGGQTQVVQTSALMSGLAGYTLLLAGTALLLVRYAKVWDDARTVLLLVVLMFLATSVTFDEVLVDDLERGAICYLGGLLFAVAVSEGVLHGIRLALPGWFRLSYYLILALFFLYPLALRPFVPDPRSEELAWGLFGFSSVAGVAFLTLLPAIRRGADYGRDNGSPWRWPLYPWTLFGVLALAVPARAFLLCWSMHLLTGSDAEQLLFGGYFLVPFGFALAILLLEIGIVSRNAVVKLCALTTPLTLIAVAYFGHRSDPVYQEFVETFTLRLGGSPVLLTLLASVLFSAYAAVRHRLAVAVVATGLFLGVAVATWYGYFALRQVVAGLDHLALSLLLFALAVLISLGKSGLLARWFPGDPEVITQFAEGITPQSSPPEDLPQQAE